MFAVLWKRQQMLPAVVALVFDVVRVDRLSPPPSLTLLLQTSLAHRRVHVIRVLHNIPRECLVTLDAPPPPPFTTRRC